MQQSHPAATIKALRDAGYDVIACSRSRVAVLDHNTPDYHIVGGHAAAKLAQGADYSRWFAETRCQPASDLIPAQRAKALAARDESRVELCDRALRGNRDAQRACVRLL